MIASESRDSLLGIIFAFIITIACLVVAIIAIKENGGVAGVIFGGLVGTGGIAAIIVAFISNTRSNTKSKDNTETEY